MKCWLFFLLLVSHFAYLKADKPQDKISSFWTHHLKTSLNINSSFLKNSISPPSGSHFNLFGKLEWKSIFEKNSHLWKSRFFLFEGVSKDSNLPSFTKSSDELILTSKYQYTFGDSSPFGFFAEGSYQTGAFPSFLILPKSTAISYDGKPSTESAQSVFLSHAFGIHQVQENLGIFWEAYKEDYLNLEFSFSALSMNQMIMNGAKIVKSTSETLVEISTLKNTYQFGSGLSLELKGKTLEEKLSYSFSSKLTYPWKQNPPRRKQNFEDSLIVEVLADLSFKLHEIVRLGTDFKALRNTALFEKFQIAHRIFLSLEYEF